MNAPYPHAVYSARLEALHRLRSAAQRREKILSFSRLAVAVIGLVLIVWFSLHPAHAELIGIPVAAFTALSILQDKLLRSIRLRTRAIEFYDNGIARLENRWAGRGEPGDRFLDAAHPYARDLDLFGHASMFQLLSTSRTRAGEETLAQWLLSPAPVAEILRRQSAVRDLAPRIGFRENLSLVGDAVRAGVHPQPLAAWGEQAPQFPSRSTPALSALLALLWIAAMAAWGLGGNGWIAAFMTLVNLGWYRRLSPRLTRASDAAENATSDLQLLAGVLALLETEPFSSPKLTSLQAALAAEGIPPSAAIRRLSRIVDALNQRHNLFLRPFDRLLFLSAQCLFLVERWQQRFGPRIRAWLAAVGELEALTSLSAYAFEHPADAFPEFVASSALFDAQALAHPLLPPTGVRNDFTLGDGLELVILSGPNMAGKSTFIRSIGLNAVLAQCGAPVRATRLRLSPLQVAASICVFDSLSGGVSRFYAEIQKLKRIADLTRGPIPVLFLLDELLSGTNSHDRLAGTEFIVRSFVDHNALGIVSTHDLALTQIPEQMGSRAANFHFEDRLEQDRLVFDYVLKPGIVRTSNALKLMQSIGLAVGP